MKLLEEHVIPVLVLIYIVTNIPLPSNYFGEILEHANELSFCYKSHEKKVWSVGEFECCVKFCFIIFMVYRCGVAL